MKILQIVKTSDGANWVFEQAQWLSKNDVEITTILPTENGRIAEKYLRNNMKIIIGDFSLPIKKPWTYFSKKRELIKIIKEENPNIIHFHFVTNILFGRLALRNTKINRLFQVPGPLHLENNLVRNIEIGLSNKFDYWAPTCKYSQMIYNRYVDNHKVFLTYYGGYGGETVEGYKNSKNTLRKEFNIKNNDILIGMISYFYKPKWYIGQKRGIKGHEDFIDAIALISKENSNVKGIIIGGPWANSYKYEQKIKKYANKKCPENIIFTGFRTDLKDIYRELDIAVHPSHSENLGGAAESLAAGVPTIATNIGGFPDIVIDGETGYLCESKNPKSIAYTIQKMLKNMEKAKRMAIAGQKLVKEKLDIENTSARILEIYEQINKRRT